MLLNAATKNDDNNNGITNIWNLELSRLNAQKYRPIQTIGKLEKYCPQGSTIGLVKSLKLKKEMSVIKAKKGAELPIIKIFECIFLKSNIIKAKNVKGIYHK